MPILKVKGHNIKLNEYCKKKIRVREGIDKLRVGKKSGREMLVLGIKMT